MLIRKTTIKKIGHYFFQCMFERAYFVFADILQVKVFPVKLVAFW